MRDPGGVGRGQPAPGVDEHLQDPSPGPRALRQPRTQRDPVDVLHDDAQLAAVRGGIEHGDHVRMAHARERSRLLDRRRASAGGLAVQDLESDRAIELDVVRDVDHSHRARAQALAQLIALQHRVAARLGFHERARRGRRVRGLRAPELGQGHAAGGAIGRVLPERVALGRREEAATIVDEPLGRRAGHVSTLVPGASGCQTCETLPPC